MTLIEWIVFFLCLLLASVEVWIVRLKLLLKECASWIETVSDYSKMVTEDVGVLDKAVEGARQVTSPTMKDEILDQALEYLENRDKDYERFL